MKKRILMVLGGTYHDFDGFARAIKPALKKAKHKVKVTHKLDTLTHLEGSRYDLVLLNTCIGEIREDGGPVAPGFTDAQVEGLASWVRGGGGLLGVHATTIAGQSSSAFRALVGGVFLTHSPPFSFTVYPLSKEHPITAGLEAFAVHDELYKQDYASSVDIHMVALDRGVAHPMVWSKREGQGCVATIAMGHGPEVWNLPQYQQLIRQAIDWLTDSVDPISCL